jgi:hypothetical protein
MVERLRVQEGRALQQAAEAVEAAREERDREAEASEEARCEEARTRKILRVRCSNQSRGSFLQERCNSGWKLKSGSPLASFLTPLCVSRFPFFTPLKIHLYLCFCYSMARPPLASTYLLPLPGGYLEDLCNRQEQGTSFVPVV